MGFFYDADQLANKISDQIIKVWQSKMVFENAVLKC